MDLNLDLTSYKNPLKVNNNNYKDFSQKFNKENSGNFIYENIEPFKLYENNLESDIFKYRNKNKKFEEFITNLEGKIN
jgi:hypothetical protein